MRKIAPCLWFNGEAEEAANFYVSLFPDAKITAISRYGTGAPFPAGTAMMRMNKLDLAAMRAAAQADQA